MAPDMRCFSSTSPTHDGDLPLEIGALVGEL
jgi:hypothetical protein